METEIADIIKIFKDVAQSPDVSSATLQVFPDKNIVKIHSLWNASDLVKAESTKFSQEFLLQTNSQKCSLLSKGFPEESFASLCAFAKSKTKFAVLKKSKKNDESVFLEIWNLSQKEKTFDMKERKEHGNIHDSGNFKSFEWSTNEKYLLYVAEAKQKKTESYFKNLFCDTSEQKTPEEKTERKLSEETIKGEENLYRETWGESHTTAHHSVLCIFEIETGKVEVLNLDDKFPGTSIAQATWGPNDEHIVFVGYKETPSRLGLIYCSNRRSSVYSYNRETKDVVCFTSDENICVEYPVFSPNFQCFVFLQNEFGGPHMSCRKLMKCDWESKEISTVIDIIDNANAADFAGIYHKSLSSSWWSNDSKFFFFHTFRGSFLEIFYVDILSCKVKKIDIVNPDYLQYSQNLRKNLDILCRKLVHKDRLLHQSRQEEKEKKLEVQRLQDLLDEQRNISRMLQRQLDMSSTPYPEDHGDSDDNDSDKNSKLPPAARNAEPEPIVEQPDQAAGVEEDPAEQPAPIELPVSENPGLAEEGEGSTSPYLPHKSYGTCVLHDIQDPYILISVSSPNIKPQLMIGHFSYSDDEIKVSWNFVDDTLDSCLKDLSWSVHTLKPSLTNECYPDLDYEILVVKSTEKNNGTLIIFPHGGPHSSVNAGFFTNIAAFARLGYTVCVVNYRGSVGLGENSIRSLLGNVGKQDVSDVVQAVEYLKKNEKFAIKQVVGFGGSHGGFLLAHLLGQHPDLLKAAVLRNPVIDLTSMVDVTDIPDWCWIESGCSKTYDYLDTKSSSFLDEMWKKSPISYIKNVKSPTLLCIGKVDLRVPPSQGLLFHKYLRAQDVPTKVYYYDDNHALSKVAVSSDVFMQSALWFQSHLSSP